MIWIDKQCLSPGQSRLTLYIQHVCLYFEKVRLNGQYKSYYVLELTQVVIHLRTIGFTQRCLRMLFKQLEHDLQILELVQQFRELVLVGCAEDHVSCHVNGHHDYIYSYSHHDFDRFRVWKDIEFCTRGNVTFTQTTPQQYNPFEITSNIRKSFQEYSNPSLSTETEVCNVCLVFDYVL